ncbi:major capsid protein [Streptomyces hainanensis]|nr:major capsid protein [Streptomyces hainanensis]
MLDTLLNDVNATDLNAFARAIPTPADFELTQTVMPERTLNSVRFRIRSSKRRVNAAKFRAWDSQTAVATRQAERIITEGMLPPLGQKLFVGELEQILLDTARGADSTEFVELLYDDVERHVESIRNRMELAAGDLLTDGRFTLVGENGLHLEADFSVPAANMPTAPRPWSDPTSDPLADGLAWIEYLQSIGGPMTVRAISPYERLRGLTVQGHTAPLGLVDITRVRDIRAGCIGYISLIKPAVQFHGIARAGVMCSPNLRLPGPRWRIRTRRESVRHDVRKWLDGEPP